MNIAPKFAVGDLVVMGNPKYKSSLNFGHIFVVLGIGSNGSCYYIDSKSYNKHGLPFKEDCFRFPTKLELALR